MITSFVDESRKKFQALAEERLRRGELREAGRYILQAADCAFTLAEQCGGPVGRAWANEGNRLLDTAEAIRQRMAGKQEEPRQERKNPFMSSEGDSAGVLGAKRNPFLPSEGGVADGAGSSTGEGNAPEKRRNPFLADQEDGADAVANEGGVSEKRPNPFLASEEVQTLARTLAKLVKEVEPTVKKAIEKAKTRMAELGIDDIDALIEKEWNAIVSSDSGCADVAGAAAEANMSEEGGIQGQDAGTAKHPGCSSSR